MSDQKKFDPDRRNFINIFLGGVGIASLGAVLYPLISYLIPPKVTEATPTTLKVAKEDDLVPNTAVMFQYGRNPGILLRTADGNFKAFLATCTHLGCTVQFRPDLGVIWCACHNGRYDINGINISGPPPRPLTPFQVNVQNGDVYVSEAKS
ncbi:MAG: Rieske 2Fe-2S domain-containing protein [bacterium]|nr:Rieske 2Fe-2S domain-containing protein [bacterium]